MTDVTVTLEDREAAAAWFELTNSLGIDHTGEAFTRALRDGSYDGDRHPLVQAFARHRLAHSGAVDVEARLTPEYLAMSPLQKWETLAVHGLLGTNEPWIEDMRRTLAALPRPVGRGEIIEEAWQPIESAPKDGTPVDLWVSRPGTIPPGVRSIDARWLDGAWREYAEWDDDEDDGREWFAEIGQTLPVETSVCKATHWMIVAPPRALQPAAPEGEGLWT